MSHYRIIVLCCVLECTASQRRVYSISTTRKFTIKCGNATSLAEGWEAGEQNKQGEGGLARTQPAASAAQESSGTTAARRTGGCLQSRSPVVLDQAMARILELWKQKRRARKSKDSDGTHKLENEVVNEDQDDSKGVSCGRVPSLKLKKLLRKGENCPKTPKSGRSGFVSEGNSLGERLQRFHVAITQKKRRQASIASSGNRSKEESNDDGGIGGCLSGADWGSLPEDLFDVVLANISPEDNAVGAMRLVCKNWHSGVNKAITDLVPSLSLPIPPTCNTSLSILHRLLGMCKPRGCAPIDVERTVQSMIPKLSGLRLLDLSQSTVHLSDNALAELFSVKSLRHINVRGIRNLFDEKLRPLRLLKDTLEHLDFSFCRCVTSDGMQHVSDLTGLKVLSLERCWRVEDVGLACLTNLQCLEVLTVKDCWRVTNNGLAQIAQIKNLKHLDLEHCFRITDLGMMHVAKLSYLEYLNVRDCWGLTDDALENIKGLSNLKELNLEHCFRITDDGLEHLSSLTMLEHLNLKDCWAITDVGVVHIASFTNLQQLDLQHCFRVTDEGLNALNGLVHIRSLNLKDCWAITDEGLSALANLKKLEVLNLEHCFKVGDQGLGHLHDLSGMLHLNLKDCWGVTDSGVTALASLPALAYLNVKHCFRVTDVGLTPLRSNSMLDLEW